VRDRRGWLPIAAALLGLVGALAATLALHRAAIATLDRVLDERLRGAGESAAALLAETAPTGDGLRAVMRANELDGAYVLSPALRVIADASGNSGRRADLLRVDVERVRQAQAGAPSVGPGYAVGTLTVMTGYFPIRRSDATIASVLVLDAGQAFVAPRARIERARTVGVALSLISALALAVLAARWSRFERARRDDSARAARGEMLSRVAAMAAHEIGNPLGVIQGTIDLMRERSAATLSERDRVALADIAGEVERLQKLSRDLLDLASDRPLATAPTDIADLLDDVARATEARFDGVKVACGLAGLPPIDADARRLRQVFTNLLTNAAQAQGPGEIEVSGRAAGGAVAVEVRDCGPGIAPDARERLFELYFTTKSGGTGLGLTISRRIVERHGGTLVHLPDRRPGATFVVTLPTKRQVAAATRGE
jgi:two-component system, OmpR family, sensor kinase